MHRDVFIRSKGSEMDIVTNVPALTVKDAALSYLSAGFSVIPLRGKNQQFAGNRINLALRLSLSSSYGTSKANCKMLVLSVVQCPITLWLLIPMGWKQLRPLKQNFQICLPRGR
jgi:hypothetical protein